MKKIISILLAVICILSAGSISTSALSDYSKVVGTPGEPYSMGDFNYDFKLNIMDVTDIQRYLAGTIWLSDLGVALGDVDHDDSLTIIDATTIQQKLAGLLEFEEEEDPDNIIRYSYVRIISLGEESETVKVGEAVDIHPIIMTDSVHYTDYLNDNFIYKCHIAYEDEWESDLDASDGNIGVVLSDPGKYVITYKVWNNLGDYARKIYEFEVVE